MMAQTQSFPSRPTTTDDLVLRLGSRNTDPKEKAALEALSKEMVKVFRDESRLSYVREAAALAPVTTASSYQDLSRAFNNAMIKGTADGNILEPQLFIGFAVMLRCGDDIKRAEIDLGPVVKSLQVRLKSAVEQAEPKAQYHLIYTLSSVLDAMIDIKTTGLSREELHEPLLKQLAALSNHQELRLAQVAAYAHQALLGITDNEGPYRALLRHILSAIQGAAKVAGAVTTMDPAKLLEGLMTLQDLPNLISSMAEVVKAGSGIAGSLGGPGVKLPQKQKSWYAALRFADMLIQAKAFAYLEQFLLRVPCLQEKEFLCGIYARLEQAWAAGDLPAQDQIVQLLEHVLVRKGSESAHPRVCKWIELVASALEQPEWTDFVQFTRKKSRFLQLRKERQYASTIPCWKMGTEALSADLLEQAWPRSIEAQVCYADIRIREYYLGGGRLMVERLSGKALSMDQCYINLAVVQHADEQANISDKKTASHQSSPFSLLARLKLETPHGHTQLPLPSLFSPRNCRDSTKAPPERVLIRGQAGMGKTTLCKKMVHDYLYGKIWPGLFNRLLWVPLRTLKGRSTPEYNLKDWLHTEYFRVGDGNIMAGALKQAVDDPTKFGRTLFILDGLDEVSRELGSETSGLLRDLLNQPHVIITTRPGMSFAHIGSVDLELETVGFYPDQVEAYIKKTASDQASKIQSFIQHHWLVKGLVRIPIQLEALCYSWDAGTVNSGEELTTMTTLYQEIGRKLWRKDAMRLGKILGTEPLSENDAKSLLDSEILPLLMPEVNFLRCLAFTGLHSDVLEFDTECQEQIREHWARLYKYLESAGPPPIVSRPRKAVVSSHVRHFFRQKESKLPLPTSDFSGIFRRAVLCGALEVRQTAFMPHAQIWKDRVY